jgi:hypothetical protein
LLRAFGTGKKRQVWVYDKHEGRAFRSSTKGVIAERGRYDFEFQGIPVTQEASLSALETRASEALKKVIDRRTLATLSPIDRGVIAAFLSVQLVRTNAMRAQFRQMGELIESWLRESAGGDPDALEAVGNYIGARSDNDERMQLARIMHSAPKAFGDDLLSKVWSLASTQKAHPFWISDHPIALHNSIDRSPRGNMGIRVPGIEIYFPLEPGLLLCIYCPTLIEQLDAVRGMRELPGMPPDLVQALRRNKSLLECTETGEPCAWLPENVEFANSLQVIHAERYIVSAADGFGLVEEMIAAEPDLRRGRRAEAAS